MFFCFCFGLDKNAGSIISAASVGVTDANGASANISCVLVCSVSAVDLSGSCKTADSHAGTIDIRLAGTIARVRISVKAGVMARKARNWNNVARVYGKPRKE